METLEDKAEIIVPEIEKTGSRWLFPNSKRHNTINRCQCGERKLMLEKRCWRCQIVIKNRGRIHFTAKDEGQLHLPETWEAVDRFLKGTLP